MFMEFLYPPSKRAATSFPFFISAIHKHVVNMTLFTHNTIINKK